jgi:hypothetical protein
MTGPQLAMFATLVATVAAVWVTLFYLPPLLARAKFEYRVTVLRDECVDALLAGHLRRTPAVESFLSSASAMAAHPEFFTLTRALAVHLATKELRLEEVERPTYASLAPDERKLLHRLDDELYQALGQRLIRGSSFGLLVWSGLNLLSRIHRVKGRSASVSRTSPQNLAREYTAISEKMPIKGHNSASLSS